MLTTFKNAYEVTTEDKDAPSNHPPAQISLTDCLACSGCVTSAEAVLVSLQSHSEVLNALDVYPPFETSKLQRGYGSCGTQIVNERIDAATSKSRLFVASISPQVRASIAATYAISESQAGLLISQLLSGPHGLASGGKHHNAFTWVVDTNAMREACLVLSASEAFAIKSSSDDTSLYPVQKPILTSACPGWICYAEKTHPHILPHLSRLKSPQALTGTLLKTALSRRLGINPSQIWHLAIMPCFDKKLESSREELTDIYWDPASSSKPGPPVRDTDCVITARELLMLADTRGISLTSLPRKPLLNDIPFPDPTLSSFLFTRTKSRTSPQGGPETGTSGGYLAHLLATYLATHPAHTLHTQRGRNADVVDYSILNPRGEAVFKAARYYGFHNIQNLVRKLRPPDVAKPRMPGARKVGVNARKAGGTGLDYVEVMACPGGCTNGGGQIKGSDLAAQAGPKEWLGKVDEAYWSASEKEEVLNGGTVEMIDACGAEPKKEAALEKEETINGVETKRVKGILDYWSESTGIPLEKLAYTSFRQVESDVGKTNKTAGQEKVLELASRW